MKPCIFLSIISTTAFFGAINSLHALAADEVDLLSLSIEELLQIKITAQKREQQWCEIPITVDVYDGHNLRENNVHQFRELSQQAPGLLYGRVGLTPNIYLRGIGSDLVSIAADASTAVYLDDVYLARPEMAIAQFWDTERIEVLKGPQGALYGRNATSGAINIIHTRPSFNRASGYAHIHVGSDSTRQIESAYGTPLGDAIAIRGSVFAIKDAGYTHDLDERGGQTIDDTDVAAARVELRWQIAEQIESSLTLDQYQNNNHGFNLKPIDNLGLAEQLGAIAVPNIHDTRNNLPTYSDYKTQGLSWRWSWMSDTFEFQSISAFRNLYAQYLLNTDGTEIPVTESQLQWEQEQRTQEFRLTSTQNNNWHWLIGATFLHESPRLDVGLIRYPLNTSIIINAQANTTAVGIYGEFEWEFRSQWAVKLGLRNSQEQRKDSNKLFSTHDLQGLNSNMQLATASGASQHDDAFSKLSPQFVLSYTPFPINNGHALWYFSATEGFKSGGANSLSTRPSFKPEEIVSYEVGYKHSQEKFLWQVSAFHYDYKELQVVTFENGFTTITNAAVATLNGMDANLLWALTEHWNWKIGVTGLDAYYEQFITSFAGKPTDVSNNPMPYAPHWDFNQEINYLQALPLGQLQISLQYHFQSLTYFNQFSDSVISTETQHQFNLRARWKLDEHWSLSADINNLTDKNGLQNITRFSSTSIASAPGGNALGVTAPRRQFFVAINYQFK